VKIIKTLIVGGGMAGIGAARTLVAQGDSNLLVVSRDIGGCVATSTDGETNYGAFYVRRDYKHLLADVTREQKIRVRGLMFFSGGKERTVLSLRNIFHLPSALRGMYLLLKYARRYRALRERCENESPVEALAADPWLQTIRSQSAEDFINEYHLEYWGKYFVEPVVRATAFLEIKQATASTVLTAVLPMIIPSWEFKMNVTRMVSSFADKIVEGRTVISVERNDNGWVAQDDRGETYGCKNIILALPIDTSKQLLALDEETNNPVFVTVVHVRGTLHKKYADRPFVFFPASSLDIWLTEEDAGTYLFYTHSSDYDLSQYFSNFGVIKEQQWDPAFYLGSQVTEIERGGGLYVIGGHNFASMEDAYISGIYAANQVLKHS